MKTAASPATQDKIRFGKVLLAFQGLLLVLFAVGVDYADELGGGNQTMAAADGGISRYYGLYQDVHVMIFIGFGFLMTFLAKYGFGAVGLNFLISALCIQWGILGAAFLHHVYTGDADQTITLSITSLIEGDFAAGAVLISFGAVLGKTSPLQMVAVVFFELIFYNLNFFIGALNLETVDMGGSMYVHTFGAYFGLAMAWSLGRPSRAQLADHPHNESNKVSDTFAMIGTVFLWMYWPSFNGALAGPTQQHRVVINTVMALCGSCVCTFVFSNILRPTHQFSMVDIQNATLAGGVAVGSASDLVIRPYAALLTGCCAGLLSVWGYTTLQPKLEQKIGLFDTCGVHNLHGMPGVLGGVAGTISAAVAGEDVYGANIGTIWPARGGPDGRSAGEQAGYQFCALVITVLIALTSGLLTAQVVKQPFFQPTAVKDAYSDHLYWEEVEHAEDDALGQGALHSPRAVVVRAKRAQASHEGESMEGAAAEKAEKEKEALPRMRGGAKEEAKQEAAKQDGAEGVNGVNGGHAAPAAADGVAPAATHGAAPIGAAEQAPTSPKSGWDLTSV